MSFITLHSKNDASVMAAFGVAYETRLQAIGRLYQPVAQWAGDTSRTLTEGTDNLFTLDSVDDTGTAALTEGTPLKIHVTRDSDGIITSYAVRRADGTSVPAAQTFSINLATGEIRTTISGGVTNQLVGYMEFIPIEGGALAAVQQEIGDLNSAMESLINLLNAQRNAIKSILNVIR